MSGPLPDHTAQVRQATAHHLKGSDHDRDRHHDTKEDGRTRDGANGDDASHIDRADSNEGSQNRPDVDQSPHKRQSAAVGGAEEAVDETTSPIWGSYTTSLQGDGRPTPIASQALVTLKARPGGAVWVAVNGADVQQLAARIAAVCDMVIRRSG